MVKTLTEKDSEKTEHHGIKGLIRICDLWVLVQLKHTNLT